MNQGGWGLKDFLFILLFITLALITTAVVYRKSFVNLFGTTPEPKVTKTTVVKKEETYKDLERKLKRAAERYQNDNYQGNYDSIETWILSYELLRKNNYLKEKITDINDRSVECNGYVKFEKKESRIDYIPYLRCGAYYKTEGYEKEYEES